MLPVVKYTVPTYMPVGPVNIYLISNSPYTLIDAGPNNPTAQQMIVEDLKSRGILPKVERIILTHGHGDHASLTATLQGLTGAAVWIHDLEFQKVRQGYWTAGKELLSKFGLTGSEFQQLSSDFDVRIRHEYSLSIPHVNLLSGGESFSFADFKLTVIHTPGHSPGGICLYEESSGTLFSGDVLLPKITPNSVLESDARGNWLPTARAYLCSLETILNFDLKYVYPGHGLPFRNGANEADRILTNYRARMAELNSVLEPGLQPIRSVAQKLYPKAQGFELFLAISKIIGLVDLLSDHTHVSLLEQDGLIMVKN